MLAIALLCEHFRRWVQILMYVHYITVHLNNTKKPMPRFADLHCHPGEMRYHQLRKNSNSDIISKEPVKYNPLNKDGFKESCSKLIKGKMAGPYLQSDYFKLSHSKTRLVFSALYPLEMGFVGHKSPAHIGANLIARIPFLNTLIFLLNVKKLNFGFKRFSYFRSGKYDYYDELNAIYQFNKNGHGHSVEGTTIVEDCKTVETTAQYRILKNEDDLNDLFSGTAANDDTTGVVLTIEGMHAFGRGHVGRSKGKNVDIETLLTRISQWKQSEFPIFFVTYSHHFNNDLCGHALSFPGPVRALLLDQRINLGADFNEDGIRALELLLNIGAYLHHSGRRILIDVKHMSPKGRQTFYHIIRKHNAANPQNPIPVIASHMGYTGLNRLSECIFPTHRETFKAEKDKLYKPGFEIEGKRYDYNAWGINLTAEDVEEIVRSKGLIGISMDERIVAAKRSRKTFARRFWKVKKKRELFTGIVLNTILGFVGATFSSPRLQEDQKAHIWNVLVLGSDFDGYINPLDTYSATVFYHRLRTDLIKAIKTYNDRHEDSLLFAWAGEEEKFVDKIMFDNAHAFLKDHL